MTSVADMIVQDIKKRASSAKGPTKRPPAKKKGDTGKRYTLGFKKKAVAYAEKHGRGGITRAMEKFNVSYIALNRWKRDLHGDAPQKSSSKPDAATYKLLQKIAKHIGVKV
jgi:hypothetical protein